MNRGIIRTNTVSVPMGMIDIIRDGALKSEVIEDIMEYFRAWNYHEVITPSIEYMDTFMLGFAGTRQEDVYKFFDSEGRTLALRADTTIPVARLVAGKFKNRKGSIRLCYNNQVFKVNKDFSGIGNESTDCGIELIGTDVFEGNLEVITVAIELLKMMRIEDYYFELGNIEIFNKACKIANVTGHDMQVLATLIDKKNLVTLDEFVDSLNIGEKEKKFFKALPFVAGKPNDALDMAEELSFDSEITEIVQSMRELTDSLTVHYDNINLDLGKIPKLHYYSGIIFEVFLRNTAGSVISGGRYDDLIGRFGNESKKAVGFSVRTDIIMGVYKPAVRREAVEIPIEDDFSKSLREAVAVVKSGKKIVLKEGETC